MGNAEGEAKLKPQLIEAESHAKKTCEERHQSQSGCVTQSLRTLGAEFSQLDFETRRIVRQKIVDDCAHDYGVCISTRATAVACYPDPSAPPVVTPEPEKKKK